MLAPSIVWLDDSAYYIFLIKKEVNEIGNIDEPKVQFWALEDAECSAIKNLWFSFDIII